MYMCRADRYYIEMKEDKNMSCFETSRKVTFIVCHITCVVSGHILNF